MIVPCLIGLYQTVCLALTSTVYLMLLLLKNLGPLKGTAQKSECKSLQEFESTDKSTILSPRSVAASAPELLYVSPSCIQRLATRLTLMLLMPWNWITWKSVLMLQVSGTLPEDTPRGMSASMVPMTLHDMCDAIKKATYDPRIAGIYIKFGVIQCGWAKLQELRRHLEFFRSSGKYSIAYLDRGGEKEYYLACCCTTLYVPPTAQLCLRGFNMSGTFFRGMLDKIGIEPQVKRIGDYKSAGDQFLRSDMANPQREQISAIVSELFETFCGTVALARGKTKQQVADLLDAAVFDMSVLQQQGWVDELRYEDEVLEELKQKTGGAAKKVAAVDACNYHRLVPAAAVGLGGRKVIGVVRACGMLVGSSTPVNTLLNTVNADQMVKQLRAAKSNPSIAAVVLRVDCPGGCALTSDIMWREIKQLAKVKPVVASMGDVAGSGGYYMSMAADKIVAESLSITGSIGVVMGKFNLQKLYDSIGYSKESIGEGKFSQLMSDHKPFTPEEEQWYTQAAEHAYTTFRDKAAESRSMSIQELQAVAQGRIWSGTKAQRLGLVDAVGGINKAINIAKVASGLKCDQPVTVRDLSQHWLEKLASRLMRNVLSSWVLNYEPAAKLLSSVKHVSGLQDVLQQVSMVVDGAASATHCHAVMPSFTME